MGKNTKFEIIGEVGAPVGNSVLFKQSNASNEAISGLKQKGGFRKTLRTETGCIVLRLRSRTALDVAANGVKRRWQRRKSGEGVV